LGVFIRLLARSATGQPASTYTTHFHGPIADGELHVVVVDNGRSRLLADEAFRRSLCCIRCGACMNTCPVFRRSGGHSYSYAIPGPIGSILGPHAAPRTHVSLPFASSLCGSCTDICPAKIDLHHQLYSMRQALSRIGVTPLWKRVAMRLMGFGLSHTWTYSMGGRLLRLIVPRLPRFLVFGPWNPWGRGRELPPMPRHSFRDFVKKEPQ
jgi:L-lactate dehydrogenase complex protein LldF